MRRALGRLARTAPVCLAVGCGWSPVVVPSEAAVEPAEDTAPPPDPATLPPLDGFDWPVGPPDGQGYYDAQPFGKNRHLGSDWNGRGGGDSDYGDPVFAVAAGRVTEVADHAGGWGLLVRVAHRDPGDPAGTVESLYAHLSAAAVVVGQDLARGERLGAIGDADGAYVAHLHLELRDRAGLPLGPGYSAKTDGYLDPSAFIAAHRPGR